MTDISKKARHTNNLMLVACTAFLIISLSYNLLMPASAFLNKVVLFSFGALFFQLIACTLVAFNSKKLIWSKYCIFITLVALLLSLLVYLPLFISNSIVTHAITGVVLMVVVLNFIVAFHIVNKQVSVFGKMQLSLQERLVKNRVLKQENKRLQDVQQNSEAELEYSLGERNLELEIALRELSEKNRELEKLSAIDSLTGLMNRRFFDKRLLAETRRSMREMTPLGVAILDIDYFKRINDTYGHLCGDHCLKEFAKLLQQEVKRPSDTISRYGGEEFVLILPNTDAKGVTNLIERIREKVAATTVYFESHQFSMTVSIGACSQVVQDDSENTNILGFIDTLLYEAKQSGRNKTIVKDFPTSPSRAFK